MDATERIEAFLRAERADRLKKRILQSEVRVIDALLANTLSMQAAYDEIYENAHNGPPWQQVIETILSVAAFFSPTRLSASRAALRRVCELSDEIEKKSRALAKLLRARSDYCNTHGISSPDDYHPLDVLNVAANASAAEHLFAQWVEPRLATLRNQFGLKYWPRTADFLDALADLQRTESEPLDELERAALDSRQGGSPRDFVRALDEALSELFGIRANLTHRSIAEIANCALGLPPNEAMTREAVKALRAYQRRRG